MTTPDPLTPTPPATGSDAVTPPPAPAPGPAADATGSAAPPSTPPAPPASSTSTPAVLVIGIILVVVGVISLLARVVDITLGASAWPLWIVVPGLAMLIGSFAIPPRAGLGLAIPGAIIAIVGGILWVQEVYGLYATWAYAWALVAPTGPGLAMLLFGLVRGDRGLMADGSRTTLVGLTLFLGLALFFEGVIGLSGHRIANLDQVLPYAVIGLGVLLVVASLFGGGRRRSPSA